MDDVITYDRGQTYYDVLGCAPSSSQEQITTEYRLKAKQFHPDKQSHELNEEEKQHFQRITEAYNVLSDENQRSDYNKWLNSGLAIPYSEWKKRNVNTLHWAVPKEETLKLTEKESLKSDAEGSSYDADGLHQDCCHGNQSKHHPYKMKRFKTTSLRRKFRDYEL